MGVVPDYRILYAPLQNKIGRPDVRSPDLPITTPDRLIPSPSIPISVNGCKHVRRRQAEPWVLIWGEKDLGVDPIIELRQRPILRLCIIHLSQYPGAQQIVV